MKRIFLLIVLLVGILFINAKCELDETSYISNKSIEYDSRKKVEVPKNEYFIEREKVAEWFKNWDSPSKISYLYIFTQQGCIGYFVVSGKPVSNRSYLLPEYIYDGHTNYGFEKQAPSLDGTYGEDLYGIRFKSANGVWHEFGGMNFSYIYADKPITSLSKNLLGD